MPRRATAPGGGRDGRKELGGFGATCKFGVSAGSPRRGSVLAKSPCGAEPRGGGILGSPRPPSRQHRPLRLVGFTQRPGRGLKAKPGRAALGPRGGRRVRGIPSGARSPPTHPAACEPPPKARHPSHIGFGKPPSRSPTPQHRPHRDARPQRGGFGPVHAVSAAAGRGEGDLGTQDARGGGEEVVFFFFVVPPPACASRCRGAGLGADKAAAK